MSRAHNKGTPATIARKTPVPCSDSTHDHDHDHNHDHHADHYHAENENQLRLKYHWQLFIGNLLKKSKEEIFGENSNSLSQLDNLKARNAWKLCLLIGSSGGIYTSTSVISFMYPILLPLVERNYLNLIHLATRSITYSYQKIHVLNTSVLSANHDSSSSSNNARDESKVNPLVLVMLENLITLSLPEIMDITQFSTYFIQQNYHQRIFQLLMEKYLSIITIDLSNVTPILRKRERDDGESASSLTSMEVVDPVTPTKEEKDKEKLDNEIGLCFSLSIRCLKELLKRLKGTQLSSTLLSSAIHSFFHIYQLNDFSSSFFQIMKDSEVFHGYSLIDEFSFEFENKTISEEIVSLFCSLSLFDVYNELFLQQMIPTILQEILLPSSSLSTSTTMVTMTMKKKERMMELLSRIIYSNESILILEFIFDFLQKQFFSSLFINTNNNGNYQGIIGVMTAEQWTIFQEILSLFASMMNTEKSSKDKASFFKVRYPALSLPFPLLFSFEFMSRRKQNCSSD
jgi:hypothetical protein